jgi:hypothetical protein
VELEGLERGEDDVAQEVLVWKEKRRGTEASRDDD